MWTKAVASQEAKESTPLLRSQVHTTSDPKKHWDKLRAVTKAGIAFRRSAGPRRPSALRRASVRGLAAFPFFSDQDADEDAAQKDLVEPCEALSPLAAGGRIKDTDGVMVGPRVPPLVKSIPAFTPYRRKSRHRSFYLW